MFFESIYPPNFILAFVLLLLILVVWSCFVLPGHALSSLSSSSYVTSSCLYFDLVFIFLFLLLLPFCLFHRCVLLLGCTFLILFLPINLTYPFRHTVLMSDDGEGDSPLQLFDDGEDDSNLSDHVG